RGACAGARKPVAVPARPARRRRGLEAAVPAPRQLPAGRRQERGVESRRLSRRRAGALRRLPHPAQRAGRGTSECPVRGWRCRQLAGVRDQRTISGADSVDDGGAVFVFASGLAGRSRQGETVLARAKAPAAEAPVVKAANATGAAIYAAACATCHEGGRALPYGGVHLGLSTALSGPDARNAANIVLS